MLSVLCVTYSHENCCIVMESVYYAGTSGILLPYKNKSYYPEKLQDKSRLAVCSLLFNSVEINSSFYHIPRAVTMLRWSHEVTDGFLFTFKLWKGITHAKGLAFEAADVARFMEAIAAVGEKKGCLLIQLPPSAHFDALLPLNRLLETIVGLPQSKGWRICVEFRHPSWYRAETMQLLDDYRFAMVLHDKNNKGINLQHTGANFIYLRFHGPGGDYRGSYDDAFLQEYSAYIKEWLSDGKDVFVYFNNTMGAAIANLNTLSAYVIEGDVR
ncbi:DUF72 domain-containing protein [Sphingobacterium sp. ML3W]|uniref:DUF72 domain-containing protein n=1 Tax=Sphingobacterium sp. ML3W TaxID=1538644 RepID=UPI000A8F882E|nr:DUF72 domain-containing protein [Sphingobacterium sp. ML3W]